MVGCLEFIAQPTSNCWFALHAARDDSQAYVLPKLTDIFQRSDSEEISRELKLLRTQCQNIVDSEINRVSECSEKIEVRRCEFSKLNTVAEKPVSEVTFKDSYQVLKFEWMLFLIVLFTKYIIEWWKWQWLL